MNRGGFIFRAAGIALCACAALLLASCSEEARDEIRSNVSDAISSVSVSGPEPTQEPAPSEEPSEIPSEEPSEEPSEQPAAEGSDSISPWIWVLLAIAAIVVALLLARMASRRREARAWRSRALAASSQGLALHDRVAAELAMGTAAAMSSTRWSDVESSIDRLATDVNQLAATATTEPDRSVIGRVSASLDGLRSAVMLQRSADAGDQASRELATQTLRERTGDFNAALRMLQDTLGAQPGSS